MPVLVVWAFWRGRHLDEDMVRPDLDAAFAAGTSVEVFGDDQEELELPSVEIGPGHALAARWQAGHCFLS
jgi:hypothetical protein